MHVLSHFLEITVKVLDLLLNILDLGETLFFLLIVGVELAEELSELVSDRVTALLALLHRRSRLVLLSHQVVELLCHLLDLLVDGGNFEVILGVVRLLEGLLGHGGNNRVNSHEEIVATFTPLRELILSKLRDKGALGHERLVLLRHLLALLVEDLTRLSYYVGSFF